MKQKLLTGLIAVSFAALFVVAPVVLAQSAGQPTLDEAITAEDQATGEVVQQQIAPSQYKADANLRPGTIVQVASEATKVKPATQDTVQSAFGVVVIYDSPLSLTGGDAGNLYVATSGRQLMMVTSEGGPIAAGDYLTVSALSGTLMKASDQEMVFAKALEAFDGKNDLIGSTTLKDKNGKPFKEIGISSIQATIEIAKNPNQVSTEANLPDQLQRLGQQVAEKEVSPVRIYISMAIVFISIIVALVTLYAGIRSAIIAIGRNPLSKKSIFRGLLEVVLTAILVLIIGLFAVYLLLRL
jgi:hypothetical protein